jgi:hypothetical protein
LVFFKAAIVAVSERARFSSWKIHSTFRWTLTLLNGSWLRRRDHYAFTLGVGRGRRALLPDTAGDPESLLQLRENPLSPALVPGKQETLLNRHGFMKCGFACAGTRSFGYANDWAICRLLIDPGASQTHG